MPKKKDQEGIEPKLNHQPFQGLAAMLEAMPSAPSVSPATKPAPKSRFPDKLVVQREKKGRGGKTVTRIRGLSLSARELEALLGELKKGLGCGASASEGEVLLQGDHCQRAADWLAKQGAARVIIGN